MNTSAPLSSLRGLTGKTLQGALVALVLTSAVTTSAQAQEKVLRVAMTAADIPRTLGQPD